MTIRRRDLRGDVHVIPKQLQECVRRFGGLNPYREPMYRMIRAESRTVPASGRWNIWAKGMSADDKAGIRNAIHMLKAGSSPQEINEYVQSRAKLNPDKTIVGMIDRPLYQFKGYIIEKWKPASCFGSPLDWYAYRFEGIAALGAYPVRGEYELVSGPSLRMPTPEQIREAIRAEMHEIDSRARNPRERMVQMLEQTDTALAQQEKESLRPLQDQVDDDARIYRTLSLGAQRFRNEMARKAGFTNNYGS